MKRVEAVGEQRAPCAAAGGGSQTQGREGNQKGTSFRSQFTLLYFSAHEGTLGILGVYLGILGIFSTHPVYLKIV